MTPNAVGVTWYITPLDALRLVGFPKSLMLTYVILLRLSPYPMLRKYFSSYTLLSYIVYCSLSFILYFIDTSMFFCISALVLNYSCMHRTEVVTSLISADVYLYRQISVVHLSFSYFTDTQTQTHWHTHTSQSPTSTVYWCIASKLKAPQNLYWMSNMFLWVEIFLFFVCCPVVPKRHSQLDYELNRL